MKRLLLQVFYTVITLLFVVVFAPLVYLMMLMLIVVLPPFLVIVSIFEDREQYKVKSFREAVFRIYLIFILLPFGLLAFAAPLRSAMLAVGSFYTPLMQVINEFHHGIIYQFFIPRYGELFPQWLDFYWGIYGVCVIFIAALMDSIRRNMLVRQIEILPTSKIHAAAIGLVELTGKAVPLMKEDEGPIIRSWIESTDNGMSSRTSTHPFYLDDGTGRVLVDPEGCDVDTGDSIFNIKLHHAILRKFQPDKGFPEGRLMPGDETYVLGNLQINDDEEDKENKVIIKPQRTSLASLNFYDLFFVSNTGEEQLLAVFKKSIKRGWFGVFILMALTGWMSVYAWTNLVQLKQVDLDAAPAFFRMVSTPTLLEREFSVGDLGNRPAIHWIDLVKQGHEKSDAIMQALEVQKLEKLAIPVLTKQALEIDHPSFGLANSWLRKLNASPAGHWGFEYWATEYIDNYVDTNQAFVYRVLLDYKKPALFASYRVFFGDVDSENFKLAKRYVVFEFANKEKEGLKHSGFISHEGWNNVDNVQVFEHFLPGEYSLDVYAKRIYFGGTFDKGSRKRKPIKIRF